MVKLGKSKYAGTDHFSEGGAKGDPRDYDPPLLSKKEIKEIAEKIKKKAGRPKKIVMESSSSESEEEKPKKKKVGRPKKVVESSSSESEEEKPKKKPVGRPKKCSCGNGLDVEPAYKKFFSALKANTTLK